MGPSAVIDPWGRLRARSEPFHQAVLHGRVEPRSEPSVYSRVGDVFGLACLAAALLALALAPAQERRAADSHSTS